MMLLMLLLASAPVPPPVLRLEVQNLRNTRGNLIVMVFPQSAAGDFPTKYQRALVTRTVVLSELTGPILLEGLAPGLAFSNGAALRWSGPPSFSDAAFELAGDVTQKVVVTYP